MAFVSGVGVGSASAGAVRAAVSRRVSGGFGGVSVARHAARGARAPAPTAVVRMAADYDALGKQWEAESADPQEVIGFALDEFPGEVGIAFSGAEDVVLVEFAHRTKKPYRVFALDTGRLHPETYRFYAQVEKHYGIRIEYTFPDAAEVTALVSEKGLFSFYEDGHQECCRVRKVRPLRKKLGTLKAWITGQRKDQSPGTRTEVPMCQVDPAFKGINDGPLVKFNPLSNTSSDEVWTTIRMVEVPYNELHDRGFVSIGCEPCTKPVLPNQHEREGRWWWEEATQKECGLHKGNISIDAAAKEATDNYVGDVIGSDKVVLFTKTTCPHCKAAKALLTRLNVSFTEVAVNTMDNMAEIADSLQRLTNQTTVPNIFIAKKHVGGNDNLQAAYKNGSLKTMLADAGIVIDSPVTA